MKQTKISVKLIQPDPNQPRKYFAADKIATLKRSISENGILNPILVVKEGANYKIVDGERRFRAATLLKLKEVPVVEIRGDSEADILVKRFQIQEYHENWSPVEKATAIVELGETLKMSINEVCNLLGIHPRLGRYYKNFYDLANREAFQKSEISIEWADHINSITRLIRKISFKLDLPITQEKLDTAETVMIDLIKSGVIKNRHDITMLKDAFTTEPKYIEDFIKGKETDPKKMFSECGAKEAYYLRQLTIQGNYYRTSSNKYLELQNKTAPDEQTLVTVRDLNKLSGEFLSRFDK